MTIQNTRISDLVPNEKLLGATVNLLLNDSNPLLTSGLAVRGVEVDAVAGGGPRKASIPFLLPLNADSVNISTDDITQFGDVDKLGASEYMTVRHDLNKGLGFADLQRMVTGYDAKGAAPAALADMWRRIYLKMAASVIKGALNNTGLTYTSAAGASVYEAVVRATATAGEFADSFGVLIVGANTYANMRVDNKIAFIPGSNTESKFDTWGGFKLLKSASFGEDIIVARNGALAFGEGFPPGMIASEIERVANGGNGGGGDILHSRRSVVLHPQGFEYKGPVAPTVLKSGSTNPQIETTANWTKVLPDEQIGFRKVVITPGA